MAQSKEYPDLKFVEARAYGNGRDGKSVRLIVIHYTAGSERSTSAEDGAAYDARRTDGTSTHYFHDRNSTVQCVFTKDRANAARHRGNRLGIQHEFCGTVQTRAQWLDEASLGTLRQGAKQVARDCKKYRIPVRRLSVAETRRAWTEYPDGPRGIVGHVDCTLAFPEDGGDHTDPGREFPWDVFLDMVRDEMDGDEEVAAPTADEVAEKVLAKINPMLSLILLAVRQGAAGAQSGRETEAAEDVAEAGRDAETRALLDALAAQPELTMADVEQAVRNVINPPTP
jgi:N-acetyl-anhydromuramyl-L-alanine amidase AmpD